jgi:hypothetical protein
MLASPASAHTPKINAGCVDNEPTLSVNLSAYSSGSHGKTNTVTVTEDNGAVTLLTKTDFGGTYSGTFNNTSNPSTGDASVGHTYAVAITAWDDPQGKNGWTTTLHASSPACVTKTTTPPPTTTTTAPPPTTTTTTAPPTSSSVEETTAPTSSSSAVVVPPVTTTNGPGGGLAYTGVSTALPLGIAGALVVVGGGLLFWIRMSAKRRAS